MDVEQLSEDGFEFNMREDGVMVAEVYDWGPHEQYVRIECSPFDFRVELGSLTLEGNAERGSESIALAVSAVRYLQAFADEMNAVVARVRRRAS